MTTDLIKRLRMVDDPLRFGLDQEAANEIERLRERAEAAAESWNALQRALKEIERQSGVIRKLNGQCDHLGIKLGEVIRERDALRADAERYRWLREVNDTDSVVCLTIIVNRRAECLTFIALDAAIDAARKERP